MSCSRRISARSITFPVLNFKSWRSYIFAGAGKEARAAISFAIPRKKHVLRRVKARNFTILCKRANSGVVKNLRNFSAKSGKMKCERFKPLRLVSNRYEAFGRYAHMHR